MQLLHVGELAAYKTYTCIHIIYIYTYYFNSCDPHLGIYPDI